MFLAAGKVMGLDVLPPADIFSWIIRGVAGAFVIAALQFLIAAQVPSFATPVAIGAAGGGAGLLFFAVCGLYLAGITAAGIWKLKRLP